MVLLEMFFLKKNMEKIGKPVAFIGKVYKSLERLASCNFSNDFPIFQIKL